MTTPRPSLLDLHPVEALLALLLISAAALHRLVVDPPRPIRGRKRFYAFDEVDSYPVDVIESTPAYSATAMREAWERQPLVRVTGIQPQASAAPAFGVSYGVLTTEERTACAAAARSAAEQLQQRLRFQPAAAEALLALTVAELRTMARQRGMVSICGRPIHKARRPDLLSALGL
jgi:hypothetical protein